MHNQSRLPHFLMIPVLSVLLTLSVFESKASDFMKIESAAAKQPTLRDHYQNGSLLCETPGRCQFKEEKSYSESRLVAFSTFAETIDRFITTMRNCLNKPTHWMGLVNRLQQILDPTPENFLMYAQKLVLKEGDTIIFKGDLHGDIHSLIAFIRHLQELGYTSTENEYTIIDPHFYLIFLGDYVDRGLWGVEVINLLQLLKIHNPHNVFLVRGNHEDPIIALEYGFPREFHNKFAEVSEKERNAVYAKIAQFYEYLPVVLYVGSARNGDESDFIQCCHGGLEMGYNPKELLNNRPFSFETIHLIKRLTACEAPEFHNCTIRDLRNCLCPLRSFCKDFTPTSLREPEPVGFAWHDFKTDVNDFSEQTKWRGMEFDKEATEATLKVASTEKVRLAAIIRAHQHTPHNKNPLMKLLLASRGCAFLWQNPQEAQLKQGTVITLLLSPDTMMGLPNEGVFNGFTYDTSLRITIGERLTLWKLTVINNEIYSKRAAGIMQAVEKKESDKNAKVIGKVDGAKKELPK